jgi:Ni/Co efflux regulator RcnB
MNKVSLPARYSGLLLLSALIAMPALAEKPDKAGKGHKASQHQKYDGGDRDRRGDRDGRDHDQDHDQDGGVDVHVNLGFDDRQRVLVRDYYHDEFQGGHCPPGLAKKGNGCMPPGQAKKWRRGAPLPRDVVYYDLPPSLVVEIGVPPPGYKYVRVAADILMIAVGTGIVVDAIDDLSHIL